MQQAGGYAAYPSYGTYGIPNDASLQAAMYDGNGKSAFNGRNGNGARGLSTAMYLLLNFIVPCIIFTGVYCLTCSHEHYTDPGLVNSICYILLAVSILLAVPAINAIRTRGESGSQFWYSLLFASSIVAWIVATGLGDANYRQNVVPYMDIQQLNIYPSVDPAVAKGQALMDAGQLMFVQGAHLDLSKSMGFRSQTTYCVAPISAGNQTLSSYDFWAVGTNCCSGHGPDFTCGEFNNPSAHSGLRLMREDQKGYFRLAVQQAEASYNINARHPLFLYWMQDPQVEIQAYYDDGVTYTLLGLFGFGAAQFVVLLLAAGASHWLAPSS